MTTTTTSATPTLRNRCIGAATAARYSDDLVGDVLFELGINPTTRNAASSSARMTRAAIQAMPREDRRTICGFEGYEGANPDLVLGLVLLTAIETRKSLADSLTWLLQVAEG